MNLAVWGDSIAKGVVYDEQRGRYAVCRESCLMKLSREAGVQVKNHSVMGQTSADGLRRMRMEQMRQGEVAVIEYGGNDCDLDWKAASEHPDQMQQGRVPVDEFAANLEEMVRMTREGGMKPVLVTPPPLVAERYFEWVSRGLNRENILKYLGDVDHIFRWQADYAERVREEAEKLDVCLVDIRSRMLAEGEKLPELMCADGIHPNERGHRLIYETVAPLVV